MRAAICQQRKEQHQHTQSMYVNQAGVPSSETMVGCEQERDLACQMRIHAYQVRSSMFLYVLHRRRRDLLYAAQLNARVGLCWMETEDARYWRRPTEIPPKI